MLGAASSSSALQQLKAARPLAPAGAGRGSCAHPTRPARLRQLPASETDCVVELLVASHGAAPCCTLPHAPVPDSQARGLPVLIRLDGLDASTLTASLAALDGHLATTCAACPAGGEALASLRELPQLSAYLERCLELAQEHKGLGPAPAVLLLQVVSRLHYSEDPSLQEAFYRRFYLPLQVALGTAAELHPEAFTPQVCLAVFEAWAALGATPMHSSAFGLLLREQLKLGQWTPQELARLVVAMAAVCASKPSYRPSQYDMAHICCALLGGGLQQLGADHLRVVAAALGHFPWPVYQCVVPLLREVAHEAARRTAVGGMSPPAGARVLQAAVASANALNPRIGAELEAEAAGWRAQGRLATGHAIPSEPACDLPSPAFI